jgi:adenylyltransferase/sulfurtransferase
MDTFIVVEPEDRYSRLQLIEWWDQNILSKARVMVIGCGALGNEVLKNLALIGVGHILLIDFDTIEISNLSRSVLFRQSDGHRYKAEVAAERIKELNPDVKVQAMRKDIRWEIGLGFYRRFDVVVGCLDNREARILVNQSCWRMEVPWVDGALQELMGSMKVFVPPEGACYECTLSEPDYQQLNERYSCSLLQRKELADLIPTTPISASVVGALQAQEVLKLLHHLDPPAIEPGSGVFFNGMLHTFMPVRYQRLDGCLSHERFEPVHELPVGVRSATLRGVLDIAGEYVGEGATLELYREIVTDFECPRCSQTESILRPLLALSEQDGRCPHCGAERIPLMTHHFTGSESFLDRTPAEVGIPPLDIVRARNGNRALFLEFSTDFDELVTFE